ncbi:MAG TPA: integrase [Cyanobacteria bacterium UBA11369]|nr:integrase [Cyanobacteria bacterium UBA11371]HBE35512.1 integrase [Cyanobacteria bacterium UBA11368]HBE52487.1 integrase [Cyanobacteria bacterium UBA11369]
MHSKPRQRKKSKSGSVQVKVSNNRLQLIFSFGGKRHYLSLGLSDNPFNRKQAQDKAFEIQRDIDYGQFDANNLDKYKIGVSLATIEPVTPITPMPTVLEIWKGYFESKRSQLKPKTVEKYENFTRLFAKIGNLPIDDAIAVKAGLQKITTVARVRDALIYLNAATQWACKHKIIASTPYVGMATEMPKPKYMTDPQPNAFSQEEMDRVIEAFRNDHRPGMNYRHYAPMIEFLFRVGCRPSEAIGLTWGNISPDCGTINFTGSLVQVGNQRVRSEGSKNNKTRSLSTSQATQELLLRIRPEQPISNALVFPSPDGDSINYRNFSRRAWSSIADPIKPDTTPYSCRDTFITLQLLKGVPTGIIAKWCDTSVQVIERHYLDQLKIAQLRPID